MKKPELTKGEWKLGGDGKYRALGEVIDDVWEVWWSEDGECVAEVVHGEANAKAMAATKDLIDALIEVHQLVMYQRIFEDDENMKMTLEHLKGKIEQALKKAGCTDE